MKSPMLSSLRRVASLSILTLTFITNYNANAESLTVTGDLNVKGIVTVGNNLKLVNIPAGSIRWRNDVFLFEGYDGTSWNTFPLSVFNGDGTTSWGTGTSASGNNATAWGKGNSASGGNATTWGLLNTVSGENAAAWGRENTVTGDLSNAWGYKNTVNGINVTAWGRGNNASGKFSTVWGFNNNANGLFATAWGRYVNAPASFSTVFGKFNIGSVSTSDDGDISNEGASVWMDNDPLLEVGAGTNTKNLANVLTLLKNGRIAFGKHTKLDTLQAQPETVQIEGALKVGDYTTGPGPDTSEGAIRFGDDGSGKNDLLAYVGGTWQSLTQGNHYPGNLKVDGNIVLSNHAGDIPAITY